MCTKKLSYATGDVGHGFMCVCGGGYCDDDDLVTVVVQWCYSCLSGNNPLSFNGIAIIRLLGNTSANINNGTFVTSA